MADEIQPKMKSINIMAIMRDQRDNLRSYRDEYENHYPRGRRPDRGELIDYAMNVMKHNIDRTQRHDESTRGYGSDTAEAHYAREAADMVYRAVRSETHLKSELSSAQYDASQLRRMVTGLEQAPTVVRVIWSEEADKWCSKIKTPHHVVRDGGQALYCFSNMKTAAIFKLMFA